MRADMSKVIVERRRHGGGIQYPRPTGADYDRLQRREGMRRPWMRTSCMKDLNENLAPLKRYLRSNVGRPWNKVFGEISERINVNSAVQLHIRQHLNDFVTLDAMKFRQIWLDSRGEVARSDFVVDARTGILRACDQRRRWHTLRQRLQ